MFLLVYALLPSCIAVLFFQLILVILPENKKRKAIIDAVKIRYIEIKRDIFDTVIMQIIPDASVKTSILAEDHKKAYEFLDKHQNNIRSNMNLYLAKEALLQFKFLKMEYYLLLVFGLINDSSLIAKYKRLISEIDEISIAINDNNFREIEFDLIINRLYRLLTSSDNGLTPLTEDDFINDLNKL